MKSTRHGTSRSADVRPQTPWRGRPPSIGSILDAPNDTRHTRRDFPLTPAAARRNKREAEENQKSGCRFRDGGTEEEVVDIPGLKDIAAWRFLEPIHLDT